MAGYTGWHCDGWMGIEGYGGDGSGLKTEFGLLLPACMLGNEPGKEVRVVLVLQLSILRLDGFDVDWWRMQLKIDSDLP